MFYVIHATRTAQVAAWTAAALGHGKCVEIVRWGDHYRLHSYGSKSPDRIYEPR